MNKEKMDTPHASPLGVSIFLLIFLASCAPSATPTPFIPPPPLYTIAPAPTPTHTIAPPLPTPICSNDLAYLDDLTIPDYSLVSPGASLDKQWLVQNTGNCNWGSGHSLRWIGGSLLEAMEMQSLYPAVAGTEAVLRINFSAPLEAGEYYSLWQAFDPSGTPFGEALFIKVIVQP